MLRSLSQLAMLASLSWKFNGGSGISLVITDPTINTIPEPDELQVSVNEPCTMYWLVNDTATVMTGAAIAAGGGLLSGNFVVVGTGNVTQAVDLSGVSGTHYIHVVAKNGGGQYSNIFAPDQFTRVTVGSVVQSAMLSQVDGFDPTRSFVMPSGIVAGNILIMGINLANTQTVSSVPSGWTLITSSTGEGTSPIYLYKKTADGSEGGATITWTISGNANSVGHFYELTLPNNFIEASTPTSGTTDAASLTPSAGSQNYIWIVIGKHARTSTIYVPSASPSGYSSIQTLGSDVNNSSNFQVTGYQAYKVSTAASEDPGAWTYGTSPIEGRTAILLACR